MPSESLQANGENKTKTQATTMWNVLSNVRVENAIEKGGESRLAVSDSLQPHGLVHGILQARILEWAAFPFSRGSSQPRDQTQASRIAGGFFTS